MSDMESDDQFLRECQDREYYDEEEVCELIEENERLRARNDSLKLALEAAPTRAEIERLRAALRYIVNGPSDEDTHNAATMRRIAREALGEDE
jgi:hypothetical protein